LALSELLYFGLKTLHRGLQRGDDRERRTQITHHLLERGHVVR